MLLGQYKTRLGKGKRIAVPKKLRKSLGEKMIVAKWYEKCLVLISQSQWESLMQRLTGQSMVVTKPVRDTDRFIMGSAYELIPDEQGRVVMPDYLAQYAGLSGEVVFLGLGNRVEIWDSTLWDQKESDLAEHASEYIDEIAKGGGQS